LNDAVKSSTDARIDEMVRRIVASFSPEKVILFGSHARGEAGADSDVDLLVVLSGPLKRREKRLAIRTALHGMGTAKDVVVVTPEEMNTQKDLAGSIVRPAFLEGRVLYDRTA
jgi:predicted nucleotidyltransferase